MHINSPAELRSILLQSMTALLEGKLSVAQANAAANLSAEAHKSIRQQWDMTMHVIENPDHLEQGFISERLRIVGTEK